jgi:hypothetical protein
LGGKVFKCFEEVGVGGGVVLVFRVENAGLEVKGGLKTRWTVD